MAQYVLFDGKRVSREWHVVLSAAREAGVQFRVNSGHRTMREQAKLYANYLRTGYPLAAKPSPVAPHIRIKRIDHALDVDALDGGAERLADWLRDRGGHPTFPVPGEAWHLELSTTDLQLLATRFSNPVIRPFRKNNPAAVRKLQRFLRARGFKSVSVNGRYDRATRSAVRRVQAKRGWKQTGIVGPKVWEAVRG